MLHLPTYLERGEFRFMCCHQLLRPGLVSSGLFRQLALVAAGLSVHVSLDSVSG
jgi:hypothetical protein